jgi:hypothetical protein
VNIICANEYANFELFPLNLLLVLICWTPAILTLDNDVKPEFMVTLRKLCYHNPELRTEFIHGHAKTSWRKTNMPKKKKKNGRKRNLSSYTGKRK